MIAPFIRRRHRKERALVCHPALVPILRETYGVILYQEQVLEIASAVAGFSLGEADSLRRAMTKDKSRAEMERIGETFYWCGAGSSQLGSGDLRRFGPIAPP